MPDQEGYPTIEELSQIEKWPYTDIPGLLAFVHGLWWMPSWGWKCRGKNILYLELHTGGWSGNEDIMNALQKNYGFWMSCWRKHIVGGHFYFRIDLKRFKK